MGETVGYGVGEARSSFKVVSSYAVETSAIIDQVEIAERSDSLTGIVGNIVVGMAL